ncbi:hypothetical protein WQ89_27360 [Escherichia coli]|nr:hypothetical protein WQ89_27360 [Escherichia coli]
MARYPSGRRQPARGFSRGLTGRPPPERRQRSPAEHMAINKGQAVQKQIPCIRFIILKHQLRIGLILMQFAAGLKKATFIIK